MAGEAYIEKAVNALHSYIQTNYAAALRTIESEQSLTASSLTDPVAYVEAYAPDDNRVPLIEVYEVGWSMEDQRNGIVYVRCDVVVSWAGDADIVSGQLRTRRYITALLRILRSGQTLSSTVNGVLIGSGESAVAHGSVSATRHTFRQSVTVMIDEGC